MVGVKIQRGQTPLKPDINNNSPEKVGEKKDGATRKTAIGSLDKEVPISERHTTPIAGNSWVEWIKSFLGWGDSSTLKVSHKPNNEFKNPDLEAKLDDLRLQWALYYASKDASGEYLIPAPETPDPDKIEKPPKINEATRSQEQMILYMQRTDNQDIDLYRLIKDIKAKASKEEKEKFFDTIFNSKSPEEWFDFALGKAVCTKAFGDQLQKVIGLFWEKHTNISNCSYLTGKATS